MFQIDHDVLGVKAVWGDYPTRNGPRSGSWVVTRNRVNAVDWEVIHYRPLEDGSLGHEPSAIWEVEDDALVAALTELVGRRFARQILVRLTGPFDRHHGTILNPATPFSATPVEFTDEEVAFAASGVMAPELAEQIRRWVGSVRWEKAAEAGAA